MLQKIRNSKYTKSICFLLACQLFLSGIDWDLTFAGDGGPTQPEVHSFEPIGTNQMVDLFTGDFTYNIPLFNLPGPDGGYPINLAYHSGAQMDQEASWVGLGWNINMGTINRQIRNLPDDFGGSQENNIKIKTDMRPNWTVGVGRSTVTTPELFGFNVGNSLYSLINLNKGFNLYYNNYRGIGYSIDMGISMKIHRVYPDHLSNNAGDLGFNLKLDSQEGISGTVTAGTNIVTKKVPNASVSTGFNSRNGWQRSVNIQASVNRTYRKNENFTQSYSGGSALSFAANVVSSSVPNSMRGGSGSISKGQGMNFFGWYNKKTKSIFFDFSYLKNKNEEVNYKGVGYMYYQNSSDDDYSVDTDLRIKDVASENEGFIHKDTRRLAIPSLSYDVYSVTGQGIGNMFRPVRNDIGTVVAPRMYSEYHGGNLGFERMEWFAVGVPASTRTGIDIGYNFSSHKTDLWPNDNIADFNFGFTQPSLSSSVYFKNYGELSEDDISLNYGNYIASNEPIVYGLKANDNFYDINAINTISIVTSRVNRRKRSVGVEAFTNDMIMDGSNTLISEFDIKYYTSASGTGYNQAGRSEYEGIRDGLANTHVGGYIATNGDGMRYVYALPAQNNKERDVVFSVSENAGMLSNSKISAIEQENSEVDYKKKGTDKYYNSIEKGKYAHSYLLTSILGMDYVDFDGISGPSDGDLGYWVKFDYAKAHDNFKWRSPYDGALYNKGYETSSKDGKGHYSYGEKEIWYVATAETKTHIAEFIVSPRNDCKQVANELDGGAGSGSYYKLDRIDVYAKSERYSGGTFNSAAKPIQSCHFEYDYSLCKKIPDNNGIDGKLTLKKVYFTYRNNTSGSTTPYDFEYNNQIGGVDAEYSSDAVDRWGNYQPGSNASNIDYPYVDPYTSKATMDERASLWNLKAINLPSGGRYEVDYESDSYAYVQNEVAMHMFKIKSLDSYGDGASAAINHGKDASAENRRVYFELEQPIATSLTIAERNAAMQKYIKPGEYLYFKVKINLTKDNSSTEYVGGYARVNNISVDGSSIVGGQYLWGYVELDNIKVNGENTHFHPFTEAGARHLRYNQPDILYDNPPNADSESLSLSDATALGWSLLSNATDIVDIFRDFTANMYKNGNDRLSDIDLDKSYLRMRTPDKIKYGGGHRVKEIRIIDNWAASFLSGGEASSTYGTVYDYNMEDENGEIISSGVAAYEPLIGGDEIPLRNPVKGWEDKNIATKTLAQTYTEEPGNESLFPGPTVGYRQVRVMSKNTSDKNNNLTSNVVHYSGITVHEFYTSKEYPVITKVSELETDKTFRKSRLLIPALIVNIDRMRMAASQGYYIELNDMHGKPKAAREIAFNSSGLEEEISSVLYEYFDEAKLTTNRAGETFLTRKLKNDVDVLYSDMDPNDHTKSDIRTSTLGTEVEFIPETRYQQSRNISAGLELNFETAVAPPFFGFYLVPSFNWKEEKTGTVVTNKIVNKAGIMKKITATQRGSVVETENLVFDDVTGTPLLTSLNNNYDNKIYNYTILAKDQYEGAGAAYKNIGFYSEGTAVGTSSSGLQEMDLASTTDAANFVEGDVLIAIPINLDGTYDVSRNKRICHFNSTSLSSGNLIVETPVSLSGLYRFTIIRSGRRNTLTAPISSITALSNPTINRTVEECEARVNYEIRTIDNILSINAVELGSKWYKETRQLSSIPTNWYDNGIFSKGFGGVYSPIRSYSYIDNRTQSTLLGQTNVNLETDGVMNDVQLFNWDNLLVTPITPACVNKWREVDQITLKNPSSFDIESRNILQTFSSKIYGKGGTEPIAVAGNARNAEIGSENFEEYGTGSLDISQNSSNNLNFYSTFNPSVTRYAEDRYDIVIGSSGSEVVKVPYTNFSIYSDLMVRIHFDEYRDGLGVILPPEEVLLRMPMSVLSAEGSDTKVSLPTNLNVPFADDRLWRGELFAKKTLPNYPSSGNANVLVSNVKGHTGDQSLYVENTNGVKFLQSRLTLQKNKEYQFSGWFSSPENSYLLKNFNELFDGDFQVEFFDASGVIISGQTLTFTEAEILQGTFIDDWQKFTLNFTMPAGAHYASFTLPCTHEVFSNELSAYTQGTYFDDLRVQPRDAGMNTYVYNQQNQRLEAELDANNYATFYYYDDEGNLFLVKRETEKGIITVQESRSFMLKD